LFREGLEFFGSEEGRGSFKGSDGGEGPARSTLSLVFDGVNGSLGSPIDGGGEVISDEGFGVSGFGSGLESLEHRGEFRGSQVHEFVKGHFEGSGFVGLVGLDFVVVGVENRESVLGFSSRSVGFSVFLLPVLPEVVDGGGDVLGAESLGVIQEVLAGSDEGGDSEESE